MSFIFQLVMVLSAAATSALPRTVSCGTQDLTNAALYNSYFLQSPLGADNIGSLNFELLAAEAWLAWQAIDLGEFRVAVSTIEDGVNSAPSGGSLNTLKSLWYTTWFDLATNVRLQAQSGIITYHNATAMHMYFRAWAYDFLASRLKSSWSEPAALESFNRSVSSFQSALEAAPYPSQPCTWTSVPYHPIGNPNATVGLHAYWCRPSPGQQTTGALVLAMSGYDGSAEVAVFEQAMGAVARGHHVLVFDGPGQGSVARVLGLTFTTEMGHVAAQVEAHGRLLMQQAGATTVGVAMWGRSFGGFLAPKAFSQLPTMTALVANGGIDDFYHGVMCDLPSSLRDLYTSGEYTTFNEYMEFGAKTSLALTSLLMHGALGFGTSTPSELYDAFSAYRLGPADYAAIGSRPVFVNEPGLDGLLANQSEVFVAALRVPWSEKSVFTPQSGLRGAGLHSSVGSTSYAPDMILDFLDSVFPLLGKVEAASSSGVTILISALVGALVASLLTGMGCILVRPKASPLLHEHGVQGSIRGEGPAISVDGTVISPRT